MKLQNEIGLMDYIFVKEIVNNKSQRGIYKICPVCNKLFFAIISRMKAGGGLFCSRECSFKYHKGENLYNYNKIELKCKNCGKLYKISKSKIAYSKYCSRECQISVNSGENHTNWKGGITPLNKLIRASTKYSDWRFSCMARDNFTCQKCGAKGVMLNVHHIKHISDIIEKYNIQTKNDWLNCDELWELDNGITVCEKCHREIHFGKK